MNILQEYKNYLKIRDFSVAYENPAKLYLEYCSDCGVDPLTVTYPQFSQFILHLKEKEYSNGYINNFLKAVRCLYNFMSQSGVAITKEETTKMVCSFRFLKESQKIPPFLTLKELEALVLQSLTFVSSASMPPEKLKAILFFMYYTGVRRAELINLKRKDINISERQAFIRVPTKNKKENIVYFPQKVATMLEEYFGCEAEETGAFNMTSAKMMHLFLSLKQLAPDDKEFSAHKLRHSFANMLARAGIDVRVAQKLLGHKSIQSTLRYYNPDQEIIKELYNKKIK